jgi:hypothetical protein
MMQFLPNWGKKTGATPVPDMAVAFEALVQETLTLLRGLNTTGQSACVFALGEKLAWFRQQGQTPDVETLAELKAIYQWLHDDRNMAYFAPNVTLGCEELAEMLEPGNENGEEGTPADVSLMIDLYNAVWALHYEDFRRDPAGMLADWNASDRFQSRAMRAVLCDIDYPSLVHLSLIVCLADASGARKLVAKNVQKKQQLMLEILTRRTETPAELAKVLQGSLPDILPTLTAWAKSLEQQPFSMPKVTLFREKRSS